MQRGAGIADSILETVSRAPFIALAALVTLGGLLAVVWTTRLILRGAPARQTAVAVAALIAYAVILVVRPAGWPLTDLAVLIGATGGALLLQRTLRTPPAVTAFLVAAAVVDVVSMTGGISRSLIEGHRAGTSDLLLYLTLTVPIRGRAIPIVGIGDLLVGGAAAVSLLRMGMRPFVVAATFSAGLLAALANGLWRGGAAAIPFIAAAVCIVVLRRPAAVTDQR